MLKPDLFKGMTFLVICLLILGSAGCAYNLAPEKDRLEASGRYGEMQTRLETDIAGTTDAGTRQLFPLCVSYSKVKRYDRLFSCLERLESNIRRGDRFDVAGPRGFEVRSDITPVPHLLRAEAYLELGRYKEAIQEARKANALFPEANSLGYYSEFHVRAYALTILSLASAFSGDRQQALAFRKELEDISLGGFIGMAVKSQVKKQALAKVCMALGDYEGALSYVQNQSFGLGTALADLVVGAGAKGESIFTYLELPRQYMISKCLLETGRLAEAKAEYDQLLKKPQTRENGEIFRLALLDRGRIDEREGRIREAIDFYRQSVDIIERQRSTINTEASKIGFVGDKQTVYSRLIGALFAESRFADAFEYAERSKSRALVDMLAAKRDFSVKAGDEKWIRALLETSEQAEAQVMVQDMSPEKSRTRSVIVTAKQQLRNHSPELASLISVAFLSASALQSLMPAGEALVEYYYGDRDMFAFILTREGLKAVRLPVGKPVDDIRQFRALMENPSSGGYLPLARRLYQRLIEPLEGFLNERNLVIVPHGALHYLPFNALYDGKGYLIERYAVRLLPSAGVMEYLHAAKSSKTGGVLAFGNPDLGDPRYDLTYAQEEARAVARTRSQSRVLLRKDATETAFRKYGTGFRYIHFATHGQFDSDAPLMSALLLAGDRENDGRLSVDKLYSLRMNADLVTLSACKTGLGKVAGGDDVVGLTRGFLYAGSRSIVASLWEVDDLATSQLMTEFYEGLKKADKREALRTAQLSTKKKYPHPYYWASFQLTGNSE